MLRGQVVDIRLPTRGGNDSIASPQDLFRDSPPKTLGASRDQPDSVFANHSIPLHTIFYLNPKY
ncbi:hypothetical protein, partial [Sphingomonas sp. SRS2]|uniref:hypothetical protein n=1 Tax=Sphingomonas sp. SRS2 TaxID=133190 RepID=UPI001F28AB60